MFKFIGNQGFCRGILNNYGFWMDLCDCFSPVLVLLTVM